MEWFTTSTILDSLRDYENEAAWGQFVARFRSPIVAFARRLGLSEPEAEDVAQEALLVFAQSLRQERYDRSKGRLSAWLFGIAYRQVCHAHRQRAYRETREPRIPEGQSITSDLPDERAATESWDKTWQQSVLRQCLERVRAEVEPKTFRAFEFTALAERPPGEVASQLGLTRNAVFIVKHRVLRRVRELQQEFERIG